MHRLARFSLAQRPVVALLTLVIVVAGVLTATSLKQELIPSLAIPQVSVTTSYPGSSPEVVDEQVSQPLADAVSGLDGLEDVTTTSRSGSSTVNVAFDFGTDTETARSDVQEAVDQVLPDLPGEATPEIFAGSTDDLPVLSLAISGDADLTTLSSDVESVVLPDIEQVEGVREATVSGARTQQIQITPDADALAGAGLTSQSITDALEANGSTVPAGTITEDGETLSVSAGQPIEDLDQLRELPLVPTAPPATSPGEPPETPEPVTLDEVADVALETPERTSITRTNGLDSLSVSVTKTPDADSVGVSHAVTDLLPGLTDDLGEGAVIEVVFDQAPFIEKSIEDLSTEGGLGLVFAVVVILVFLLSARSTLVTAISIPLSVLVTLIGLAVAGYSLNILTLGALTIAIGRVVDDSIVVIENIKRHLSYGEDKRDAVLTGVREVAGAITSSTLATAAVFVPIAVVGGLVGVLFRPFALTVVVALLSSLLVALTIVPVLAFWFLKSPAGSVDPERVRHEVEQKERRSVLQRSYVPLLAGARRRPVATLLGAALLLVGTVAMVPLVETDFLGDTGQNQLSVTQELPVGTELTELSEAAAEVETALLDVDGVDTVQSTIGGGDASGFGFGGGDPISYLVTTDAEGDQEAIQADASEAVGRLSGVGEVSVGASSEATGVSSDVEVLLEAEDETLLEDASEELLPDLEDVAGVEEVTSDLAAAEPTLEVVVDRAAAADQGLTEAQVSGAVAGALNPRPIASLLLDGEDLSVVLDAGTPPETVAELRDLALPGLAGEVALSEVAEVSRVEVPQQISSTDGERVVTLTLTPEPGVTVGTLSAAVQAELDQADLDEDVVASLGGVSADQQESFAQLGVALLAAIAIVFVVMVATFRSLLQPFILLVSIPFAATGALLALLLTGTPLGVAALIGLLMLVGIVVTNAIVLIDLVNQYREQGQPVAEAVVNGARQRLRPVLMTALATIGALTPMALGLTGGSAFISQSLAVVVIGGLISSTALTLILVPVLYGLVEGARERRHHRPVHAEHAADGWTQVIADDRVQDLERENTALKRMVADAELRQMALRESARRAMLPGPGSDTGSGTAADDRADAGGRGDQGDDDGPDQSGSDPSSRP